MNFVLTEEQSLIRDMVRSFAESELTPGLKERDEHERFDRALMFDRLADLGLTGLIFPEEYGGSGKGKLEFCIAVEELTRASAAAASYFRISLSLGIVPVIMYGTDEQKKKILPKVTVFDHLP